MSAEAWQFFAAVVGIVSAAYVILEKVFWGSHALANKFAKLKDDTSKEVGELRKDFTERVDRYESNAGAGFERLTANLHFLQVGFLEFRVKMAEGYISKDDNRLMYVDFKQSLDRQFDDVKEQLRTGDQRMGRIEDLVASLRAEG